MTAASPGTSETLTTPSGLVSAAPDLNITSQNGDVNNDTYKCRRTVIKTRLQVKDRLENLEVDDHGIWT